MRVKARAPFVGKVAGKLVAVSAGQELDLPDDCDWLAAGLVVEVAPAPTMDEQEAILTPAGMEYAVLRRRGKRTAVGG